MNAFAVVGVVLFVSLIYQHRDALLMITNAIQWMWREDKDTALYRVIAKRMQALEMYRKNTATTEAELQQTCAAVQCGAAEIKQQQQHYDNIDRISSTNLQQLQQNYINRGRPVVVTDVGDDPSWQLVHGLTLQSINNILASQNNSSSPLLVTARSVRASLTDSTVTEAQRSIIRGVRVWEAAQEHTFAAVLRNRQRQKRINGIMQSESSSKDGSNSSSNTANQHHALSSHHRLDPVYYSYLGVDAHSTLIGAGVIADPYFMLSATTGVSKTHHKASAEAAESATTVPLIAEWLYFGQRGTGVLPHTDSMCLAKWSYQVRGVKQWTLAATTAHQHWQPMTVTLVPGEMLVFMPDQMHGTTCINTNDISSDDSGDCISIHGYIPIQYEQNCYLQQLLSSVSVTQQQQQHLQQKSQALAGFVAYKKSGGNASQQQSALDYWTKCPSAYRQYATSCTTPAAETTAAEITAAVTATAAIEAVTQQLPAEL